MNNPGNKHILVIDRLGAGESDFAQGLKDAGYAVTTLTGDSPSLAQIGKVPDLVILACASINREERDLIQEMLAAKLNVLTLCSSAPWNGARALSITGVNRMDESSDIPQLVAVVDQMFINQLATSAFEVAHQLSGGLGLISFYVSNIRAALEQESIMSASINEELEALLKDVKKVQNLSKGMKENIVSDEEPLVVSSAHLLRQAKWALPTVPDNIQMRDEIADDLASVTIISGQILSVLHNLVLNAVEAMPDGGAIALRAFNQSPFVQIEVADTGPGIRSEEREKIFNLFYSTKENPGFGLWKSRQYARANGGELTLASEPGRGATFILTLPMADTQAVGDGDARLF